MTLPRLEKDLSIIAKLADRPEISAAELKAKFDEAVAEVQDFINDELVAELEGLGIEQALVSGDVAAMKYIRINADMVLEVSADGLTWQATGSSGHLIYDKNGQQLPQRSRLKFINSEVSDDGTYTIVQGLTGPPGAAGPQGVTGATGAVGPKGDKGAAWYPELDSLGKLTFTLSDSDTPPPAYNIRGPQGPQGVQGLQGAIGATGPQGPQGTAGAQGPAGVQGPAGPTGAAGATGPQGPTGAQGATGPAGSDGSSFVVKALYASLFALQTVHPQGEEGDAYAVGTAASNVIYIWDADLLAWRSLGALQGPQGPQGPAGAAGPAGPEGEQGPAGPQGIQGSQGIQGPAGAQGLQGIQGPSGLDGKSAYQSAVEGGYSGTEEAFNDALVGVGDKLDSDGDGQSVTISFVEAAAKSTISSGETLAVIMGKLKKWFSSFGAAAWLGVDEEPTEDSGNVMQSGGAYAALAGKLDSSEKGAANGVATLNASSKVNAEQASAVILAVSANTTLSLAHAGCLTSVNSASAITVTIPTNASVAFEVGTEMEILRFGAGAVTIAAASGVTIVCAQTERTIAEQYNSVCLKKLDTNTWLLQGVLG